MKTTCLPFDCTGHASSSAIGGYRYFFNGQEADNEVFGDGVLHAFEYRITTQESAGSGVWTRWPGSSRGTARMRLRRTGLWTEES